MIVKVLFANGKQAEFIVAPTTTLVDFVERAQSAYGSNIKTIRVVRRERQRPH